MIQPPYRTLHTHVFVGKTKHGNLFVMMHPVYYVCSSIIFTILEPLWFEGMKILTLKIYSINNT